MHLKHMCPECGEQENIDVIPTIYLCRNGSPRNLILTFTCQMCNHQWSMTTDDFDVDEDY